MTPNPKHLTADEIAATDPSAFSVRLEDASHKNYWCVDFQTELGQVFLSEKSGKPVKFESETEAIQYCTKRWPDARLI
jgi:hypothetical protein